ncbi:hypothetical protein I4U23_011284 [Adineta vaga]|nr:hypothetical protein I4U23_011284 [Adineta vaga]
MTSTWDVINLPTGNCTPLFRVFNGDQYISTFAIDNIAIMSCDYPSFQPTSYKTLLMFSCDFDQSDMCSMTNTGPMLKPTFNFMLSTDQTHNSTLGGFLYWNRQLPLTLQDSGRIMISKTLVGDSDDSQGWQLVLVNFYYSLDEKIFYLYVNQSTSIPVSIVFDDIKIDLCNRLSPTTISTSSSSSASSSTKKLPSTSTNFVTTAPSHMWLIYIISWIQ